MSVLLETLLENIPSDTEERVYRTKKRFNNRVRKVLRRETGLRLTDLHSQEARSVRIHLVPGLPESLQKVVINDDDKIAALLAPWKHELIKLRDSSYVVKEELIGIILKDYLKNCAFEESMDIKKDILDKTHKMAETMLKRAESFNLVEWILAVNDDVLGAYFYSRKSTRTHIELYWGVIGLIAQLIGVSVDDLTVVILVHELGHAYSHIGFDIDGHKWHTEDFNSSEHPLREGIAQYYTARICEQLSDTSYSYEAYEKLLLNQPEAYSSHKPWLKNYKPEEVRLAMIETRREGKGTMSNFSDRLEHARSRLRKETE